MHRAVRRRRRDGRGNGPQLDRAGQRPARRLPRGLLERGGTRRRDRDRNARRRWIRKGMKTGRIALASVAGTALEYYDFAVYNTLAALVFKKLFFPSFDPLAGTLLSFATYWLGFLSRPIGGIVFGHLGD